MTQPIDPKILEAYRQERKNQHIEAKDALKIAREHRTKQELPWKRVERGNTVKYTTLERDGFQCRLEIQYDYDHDWCNARGKFTNNQEPGAIIYPESRHNNRVFKYFVPENSAESHREELIKMGYSKQQAQEMAEGYVNEDMKIAADPNAAGYEAYGVVATVSLKGIKLGEAACWGIETNQWHDDPYLEECALEELDEALHTAKKKLKELQTVKVEEEQHL